MNQDQENRIYADAIDFFGLESQKIMAIEEMSELNRLANSLVELKKKMDKWNNGGKK